MHEKWLEEPPAELREGTKLIANIVMLGMANKIEWTIEAVDAQRSLVLGATGMVSVKARFTFTINPIEDRSVFTSLDSGGRRGELRPQVR